MTGEAENTGQRLRMGVAAGAASLALAGLAGLTIMVATRPEPAIADMADHAGLKVVAEPFVREAPKPQGRLATLDPVQVQATETRPEPVDPALVALMVQERREQAQALAEQRAFDAHLRAEMASPVVTYDTPREPPATRSYSTSNSEDTDED